VYPGFENEKDMYNASNFSPEGVAIFFLNSV
jgi:hypothetical protein